MWIPCCSCNWDLLKKIWLLSYPVLQGGKMWLAFLTRCIRCWLQSPETVSFQWFSIAVSERAGYVCFFVFICYFWPTTCRKLWVPNTTKTFLRSLLFRMCDFKRSKINAKDMKSPFLILAYMWLYLIHSTCLIKSWIYWNNHILKLFPGRRKGLVSLLLVVSSIFRGSCGMLQRILDWGRGLVL